MTGLADLQRAFQSRILLHELGIEVQLVRHDGPDFEERLGTYVGGYRARLVEALGTTYSALRTTLGVDEFDRLMRTFIEATPSRHPSVRHYGEGIAAHLIQRLPGDAGTTLADLAHWEWTLADVFDAPDDEPLGIDALATVPPASWGDVSFRFRAALRRAQTRSNAVDYWRAANAIAPAPAALAAAPAVHWILWRRGLSTFFRSLDPDEHVALEAAAAGATFAVICERLADDVGEEQAPMRAASLLRGWLAEELIAGLHVPGES